MVVIVVIIVIVIAVSLIKDLFGHTGVENILRTTSQLPKVAELSKFL